MRSCLWDLSIRFVFIETQQISILSFVPFIEPFTRVYRSSNKKFNLRLTIIQLSFLWHLRNSRFYLSDCLTSATFNSCPSLESLLRYSMDIVQSRQMSYRYSQHWDSPTIYCENIQAIGSWGLKKIICRALQSNYWKVEGGIEFPRSRNPTSSDGSEVYCLFINGQGGLYKWAFSIVHREMSAG